MNIPETCKRNLPLLSAYLDGALNGHERRAVTDHLEQCSRCASHFTSLQRTVGLTAALGPKAPPPDLALRIRVAVAQQRRNTWHRRWQSWTVRLEDTLNAFMLPATGGLVTATVMLGVFLGFFALPNVSLRNDVPTTLYIPPRIQAVPFGGDFGLQSANGPVVIEAYVNSSGRLEGYRIIAGEDTKEVRSELDRTLIFTTFVPAMSFGAPTRGNVMLTFARVSVRG